MTPFEPSKEKWKTWLPLLLAISMIIGMLVGLKLQKTPKPLVMPDDIHHRSITGAGQGKVEELLRYIESKYVDKVDRDELVDKAIQEILEELDPHSTYISAEELKEVSEQMEGNFEGIGVEFMILEDTIRVVTPLSGGPSEAVGILAGDKIVQIADSIVAGINLNSNDVISMLRGKKGTQVKVGIRRGYENDLRFFTITRDKIPIHSVDVAYMLNEETGFIKVNRFSATTYKEFMTNMEILVEQKGMKNLILDLRHNPGGYLQEATKMLSQLFDEGDKLLVYTEGRTVHRNDYESTGRAFFDLDKIAVLVDEGSASASEIMAGAIQDWDRGLIIGRRTFGKGLVQEQYQLRDGSALRLTVARYYTPSGRLIQKSYDDVENYDEDVHDRLQSGELENGNNNHADSSQYYTSKGRVVFGGGGITPDVFVPIDTLLFNEYNFRLRQHIPTFIYKYIEKHQSDFNEMDLDAFLDNYLVSDQLWQEFMTFAYENGVDKNESELALVAPTIKRFLKARIGRKLFGDEGYFSVWNQDDPVVNEALNALKKPMPTATKE